MTDKKEKKAKLPEEIWVKRSKANLCTICFNEGKSLRVFPGLTRITDPVQIELIHDKKAGHAWDALIKSGVHKIVTKESEGKSKKETSVFTAMDPKAAIALVDETYSIPALEQMFNDESHKKARKTVLAAIESQIEEMKTPDKDQ